DLTAAHARGETTLELEVAKRPPDGEGRYHLVALAGGERAQASVAVRGIVRFEVRGKRPDDPSKRPPQLLRRVMEGGHPRYGTDQYRSATSVEARAGALSDLTVFESEENQHWWWG